MLPSTICDFDALENRKYTTAQRNRSCQKLLSRYVAILVRQRKQADTVGEIQHMSSGILVCCIPGIRHAEFSKQTIKSICARPGSILKNT